MTANQTPTLTPILLLHKMVSFFGEVRQEIDPHQFADYVVASDPSNRRMIRGGLPQGDHL